MDVNQVRFGNYSIGNSQGGAPKKSEKEAKEAQQQPQYVMAQNFDVDDYYSALGMVGMQNMAFVSKTDSIPNPDDYLSQDRISDIEAAMAVFENGVDEIANTIDAEFPNMFAPDQRNALAAQIFAAE